MEENRIETRNRSRSKTPFLRSNCDNEQCANAGEDEAGHHHHHNHSDKKNKSSVTPKLKTLPEETIEVANSSSPQSKPASNNDSSTEIAAKQATTTVTTRQTKTSNDEAKNNAKNNNVTSTNEIKEKNKQISSSAVASSASTSTTTVITTKIITKSQKQIANNNIASVGRATTSTPKTINLQESFAKQFSSTGNGESGGSNGVFNNSPRSTEVSRNESSLHNNKNNNSSFERSRRQNAGKSISNIAFSNDISSNIDLNEHIAYKEYKEAGEYWKKYPKTDYTYSELSPHRREIVPGVIAMPNMSRQSLEKHNERINYMIQRNPEKEEYIRKRYDWSFQRSKNHSNSLANNLIYDSQDELDTTTNRRRFMATSSENWFTRFVTLFVGTITSCWFMIAGFNDSVDDSGYYGTKITKTEKGFFGAVTSGISLAILKIFQYIYMFISTVLCLDTWILQSPKVENKNKKRFLLFLLILLPLLLLAGLYYYLHPNEPFPPTSFSKVQLMPDFDMSKIYDQKQYEEMKTFTIDRFNDIRTWTDDYFSFLKTVSNNIFEEGKKLFGQTFYERV